MTKLFRGALLTVLLLGLSQVPALAAGGAGSPAAKENKDLVRGAALVDQKKYAEAIPHLQKAIEAQKNSADAYNLLGYSHRKLGDRDAALTHYLKALSFDPMHRGANEYLGELYLEMGDLARAEERLSKLNWACLFGCEEYTELKQAIEAYKAANGG